MSKSEGLLAVEKPLALLPASVRNLIFDHFHNLIRYEPVIGIMGKTGAGKSSLCNALFDAKVTSVNDVTACTREALHFRLYSGEHSLVLVDLPGVGETGVRDEEYEALYRNILPKLDLILWIIKADDRALSIDEHFYQDVMAEYQHRVLFVVNQADKIEPSHEWDTTSNMPSPNQSENIEAKQESIRQLFSPFNPVSAVSTRTAWNLPTMVETMMNCLPDRATSPLATQLHKRLCTEPVKKQAREGFGNAIGEIFDSAESSPLVPTQLKKVIRSVREAVVSVAHAVWDWIFF